MLLPDAEDPAQEDVDPGITNSIMHSSSNNISDIHSSSIIRTNITLHIIISLTLVVGMAGLCS